MKIAPTSEPLQRPTLEEIKQKKEDQIQETMIAYSGLVLDAGEYYDFWAKKIRINREAP